MRDRTFRCTREHEQERNEELEDEKRKRDRHPSARRTVQEEDRFFRQVCVPDQEELREPDVRVEDRKGLHVLREIVQVFNRDPTACIAFAEELSADNDHDRIRRLERAREAVNAPHRRVPVRL